MGSSSELSSTNSGVSRRFITMWTLLDPDDVGLLGGLGAPDAGTDGGPWASAGGGGARCKGKTCYTVSIVIPLYLISSLSNNSVVRVAQAPWSWNLGPAHPGAPVIIKSWYRILNATHGATVGEDHNSLYAQTVTLWNSKKGSYMWATIIAYNEEMCVAIGAPDIMFPS